MTTRHGCTGVLVNVDDYRREAEHVMPRMAYHNYAAGAADKHSLQRNQQKFQQILLRPRGLVDVSVTDYSMDLFGVRIRSPIIIAPTAFQCLAHAEGEKAMARAAAAAATIMACSTWGTTRFEDIAAQGAPTCLQVYVYKQRDVTRTLIQRAEAAGARALMLTIDTAYLGRREDDIRNGFALPPHLSLANFDDRSMRGKDASGARTSGLAEYVASLTDHSLNWQRDIPWLRSISQLPLLVKGVMTEEDAVLAVRHGVDGIIVSNHGARQLDTVPATIEVLEGIVAAVRAEEKRLGRQQQRTQILLDGGIRRGTDVVKALALGADAVMVGRPVLWGLASAGEDGVRAVMDILHDEFQLAMRLLGARCLADLRRSHVLVPMKSHL